ncbi:MAG: TIGR00730 family Rossman fold protein [Oligoflexia bacterium]|nr:TIGR00730 family Rossman fold protein [Oligoflexia bacterium]
MKNLCVFCGSSAGKSEIYVNEARTLGNYMAENNLGLVYGGASIGVMGAVADGVLEKDGKVIGIIPQSIIDLEVGHQNLTNLYVVDSMHERKQKMYDLSDAFLAIPGGIGTLDELCEIFTWAQLEYHKKPIYIVNHNGFFDHLLKHFEHCVEQGFVRPEHLDLFRTVAMPLDAAKDFLERS